MNRIYRKVWNKALGQMVVASELASRQGAGRMIDERRCGDRPFLTLSAAIAMALGGAWAALPASVFAQSVEVGGNAPCLVLGNAELESCVVDGSATASGANAVAIGTNTLASGDYSFAAGANAQALGESAVAIGSSAVAAGELSTATGALAQANGDGSVAT
uniref:ESPR-type extended signal peptide-containing protein n=1 Tax=Stenotrophomonas sp. YIM B06876 TaxID=3060211 RepID=UPI0027392F10